jgi:hypothetical protein
MDRVTTGPSYAVFCLAAVWAGCSSGSPLKPEGGGGGGGSMAGSGGAMVTCADRVAAIKATIDPVVTNADRTCKIDADCTSATIYNACYGVPCSPAYVSLSGAAAITAELKAVEAQDCDAVEKAGCATGQGRYSCPAEGVPVCVAGLCQDGRGLAPPSPDGGTGGDRTGSGRRWSALLSSRPNGRVHRSRRRE